MRPIPAPRLGDAHGLLRAIGERERLRLDEFVTEFTVEELFPPGLENALGRTRQFVSFARSAGLVNEDRGTFSLTDMGKRYVRAADRARPFDVAPAQAEWLRRLLRERHMTDSIYHGAAVALSLFASNPPGFRASTLDFGRALNYLGRAGWDSENTFQSQGERYATFLQDLGLVDGERRLTAAGQQMRDELTLPIHMSLKDLAGQLNPGGPEAAERDGEAEWAAPPAPDVAVPEVAPVPAEAPAAVGEEDEYEDVGPGAGPSPAAAPAPPAPPAAAPVPPAAPAPAPAAAAPPTPPADIWESAPDERTQAYRAVGHEPPAVETPVPAEAAPAAPTADAPVDRPAARDPLGGATIEPSASEIEAAQAVAAGEATPHEALGAEPPVASGATAAPPAPAPPPPPAAAPSDLDVAATAAAPALVSAAAIRAAAREAGLRLPDGVYAALAAALAGGHVVLVGPAGCGKTTLALAAAKAAAQAGKSSGATLVTAGRRWSGRDTVGRSKDGAWERGAVVDAAARGRWLVVDELDRARLDRALGELSSFLGGAPVALPDGEAKPPAGWRVVATAASSLTGSPALVRRFAHVHVPPPGGADLAAALDAAAGGDATAAAAVKRLLGARDLGPAGTGAFLDAARFAARRNATAPADEATLAREALAAHIAPLLGELDEDGRARLVALTGA
jgi:MoxR-like ATPase